MLRELLLMFLLCLARSECAAVPKPHVITFGKWISAKWPNATGQKLLDLKVRPLFVDTRLKEYTTGTPHDLTDRLFVVRRTFRVNDALPTEKANANATRWQWQRGGWLLVDKLRRAGCEPDECYIIGLDPEEKLTRPHFVRAMVYHDTGATVAAWPVFVSRKLPAADPR